MGAIPGLAKGTTSIELASGAEKSAAGKPEALGPEAYGKGGRGCVGRTTAARRGQTGEHKPEALASAARTRKKMRTRAQLATARSVTRGHPVHLKGSEQPLGIQEGWMLESESSIRKGLLRPTRTTRRESMPTTILDASEYIRRWHYLQQKQPRTCIYAPSSHLIVEELGPF